MQLNVNELRREMHLVYLFVELKVESSFFEVVLFLCFFNGLCNDLSHAGLVMTVNFISSCSFSKSLDFHSYLLDTVSKFNKYYYNINA